MNVSWDISLRMNQVKLGEILRSSRDFLRMGKVTFGKAETAFKWCLSMKA